MTAPIILTVAAASLVILIGGSALQGNWMPAAVAVAAVLIATFR